MSSSSIVPPTQRNYCLDCEWSASIEDHDRHELAALAIEHATEQEHDIDSDVDRGERAIGSLETIRAAETDSSLGLDSGNILASVLDSKPD